MMKENKRTLIITSIITILPVFIGLFLWNRLPDTMATHFGFDNKADGFSSKGFAVVGVPLILLSIEWVGAIATSHDPKKNNISQKMFSFVLWIIPLLSLTVTSAMYSYNLGYETDMVFISGLIMGMVFVIVGNYLPKARQNFTIGIKIPWTLANEENWNHTHRLAGFMWVLGGILMIIGTLTGLMQETVMGVVVIVMVLIPCIYSYYLHVVKKL